MAAVGAARWAVRVHAHGVRAPRLPLAWSLGWSTTSLPTGVAAVAAASTAAAAALPAATAAAGADGSPALPSVATAPPQGAHRRPHGSHRSSYHTVGTPLRTTGAAGAPASGGSSGPSNSSGGSGAATNSGSGGGGGGLGAQADLLLRIAQRLDRKADRQYEGRPMFSGTDFLPGWVHAAHMADYLGTEASTAVAAAATPAAAAAAARGLAVESVVMAGGSAVTVLYTNEVTCINRWLAHYVDAAGVAVLGFDTETRPSLWGARFPHQRARKAPPQAGAAAASTTAAAAAAAANACAVVQFATPSAVLVAQLGHLIVAPEVADRVTCLPPLQGDPAAAAAAAAAVDTRHAVGFLGTGAPAGLLTLLRRRDLVFVGVNVAADVALLVRSLRLPSDSAPPVVDVDRLARELGIRRTAPGMFHGLEALAHKLLGTPRWKSGALSLSNWSAAPLSARQVRYAALDAWAGVALFDFLTPLLPAPGTHTPTALARALAASVPAGAPAAATDKPDKAHTSAAARLAAQLATARTDAAAAAAAHTDAYRYLFLHDVDLLPPQRALALPWLRRRGIAVEEFSASVLSRSPFPRTRNGRLILPSAAECAAEGRSLPLLVPAYRTRYAMTAGGGSGTAAAGGGKAGSAAPAAASATAAGDEEDGAAPRPAELASSGCSSGSDGEAEGGGGRPPSPAAGGGGSGVVDAAGRSSPGPGNPGAECGDFWGAERMHVGVRVALEFLQP